MPCRTTWGSTRVGQEARGEKERAWLRGFIGAFMRKSREPREVTEEGSDEML